MALVDSLVAVVGTFLLTVAFYSLTAHLAARYVLGDVPIKYALVIGTILAVVSFLLQQYGLVALVTTVIVDFVAIRALYRLRYRTTGLVVIVHVAVSAILLFTLLSLVRLLGTAPS